MAPSGSLQSFDGRTKGRLNGHPKTNMRLQTPGFDVKLWPIKMCNSFSMGGSPHLGKPSFRTQWIIVDKSLTWRVLGGSWYTLSLPSVLWISTGQLPNSTFSPSQVCIQGEAFFYCQGWGMANTHTGGAQSLYGLEGQLRPALWETCCRHDKFWVCSPLGHTCPQLTWSEWSWLHGSSAGRLCSHGSFFCHVGSILDLPPSALIRLPICWIALPTVGWVFIQVFSQKPGNSIDPILDTSRNVLC